LEEAILNATLPATLALTLAASPSAAEVWAPDADAVRAVNLGLSSPLMDGTMRVLSGRVLLVAAPFAAVPYTYQTRGPQAALETGGSLAAAELLAGGAGYGLKVLIGRPRPYEADPSLRTPDGPEDTPAMPSNHASLAFGWATVLAADEPVLFVPAYLLATGIAFSRMYNGVHYPSDLAAGALLGIAAGTAVVTGREVIKRGRF
jgi:undecaprenyl-diphosphatase